MAVNLEELIFRCIDRYFAGRYAKRYGLCTSWDAKKHMAKVLLQPEGTETGWIAVHTMAAGDGYGMMTGIKPGEQLEVTYQEGDYESGAITARVHSKKQKPPKVESGEVLIQTPFGSFIKLDKNSAITIDDANGATVTLDGQGNLTLKCKALSIDAGTSDITIKANNIPMTLTGIATINGQEILTAG